MEYEHRPVMLEEVLDGLRVRPGGVYLDCTVGGAGHLRAIAERARPGRVIGLDRDPAAVAAARERLVGLEATVVQADFRRLREVLDGLGIEAVDGVLFDLGVSSHQLDTPGRGFSYREDGPLDMRMDPGQGVTAADLVNGLPREQLARIIREFGEERWADRIAAAVCRSRPVSTTGELTGVILGALPARARGGPRHPARRTFQALRVAVNGELDGLAEALEAAVESTRRGGRICVVAYHSLEDRIVKGTLRHLATDCLCPPQLPVCMCGGGRARLRLVSRLTPLPAEREENPRSRSARLRVAERLVLGVAEGE
ncbi:MAG: 16S rRNA (cytosine(1402)-N(4))-methyltransferase RsmH [bacterium]|nr:16S rRNA (cytosine(1402)-N(4))-methyltransferase RsmH [bacterium]